MKIAVMQPYVFPYLGYYQLVNSVDKFIFFDDVSYIKKGWINKNNILVNNKVWLFTIPVKEASQNKLIHQIELSDYFKWKDKFLKTLEMAYSKAPYYSATFDLILSVLNQSYQTIAELAQKSITEIAEYLELKIIFEKSSNIKYNTFAESGQEKILDICKIQEATMYINPINGKALYNKEIFINNNIELCFIRMDELHYVQFSKEKFVPSLSIIDILMFNDKEVINQFLQKFTLE